MKGTNLFALNGLDESSLFTANVGAATTVNEYVKIVASSAGVLANQTGIVGL